VELISITLVVAVHPVMPEIQMEPQVEPVDLVVEEMVLLQLLVLSQQMVNQIPEVAVVDLLVQIQLDQYNQQVVVDLASLYSDTH
jgi:hypothetical protein